MILEIMLSVFLHVSCPNMFVKLLFADCHQLWAPGFPAVCLTGTSVSVLQESCGLTAPTRASKAILGYLELCVSPATQKTKKTKQRKPTNQPTNQTNRTSKSNKQTKHPPKTTNQAKTPKNPKGVLMVNTLLQMLCASAMPRLSVRAKLKTWIYLLRSELSFGKQPGGIFCDLQGIA